MSATGARVELEGSGHDSGGSTDGIQASVTTGRSEGESGGVGEAGGPGLESELQDNGIDPLRGCPSVPTTDAEEAEHRHKALTVARIRMSKAPTAVKERFAELAEAANNAATVEACLQAVEEALPEFLSASREDAARKDHPAGEVFFRGNAEEITDEQAEELARAQLARSGLLRGQRVRVAD